MATGTVKWFNGTKGYGFVAPDDGDADIFIHISQVQKSGLNELQENQQISFALPDGERCEGEVIDVDENGALVLEVAGKVKRFISGEIQIKLR